MKHLIIDLAIVFILLIAICTVGKAAAPPEADNKCYASCRQFESALLVGCYLADRDPSKTHKEHEDYCKELAKELMGKDSGCK